MSFVGFVQKLKSPVVVVGAVALACLGLGIKIGQYNTNEKGVERFADKVRKREEEAKKAKAEG